MDKLTRLFKLRAGEGPRVSLLALQYFFVVAVTIAAKTTRDTYFLSRFDRSYLPLMFSVCAGVVALLALLYARVAPKLGKPSLLNGSYSLFIAVLLVLNVRMTGLAVPFLYVWVEAVISIATLQFWLQAADCFDAREAKRVFGLIGAGGALAAFVTGMGMKPYVKVFGPDSLLLLVCGGLAASWIFGTMAAKYEIPRLKTRNHPARPTPVAKLDSYLISIAIIVGLSAAVTQIVDYQFKVSAAMAIQTEGDLASFFGRFYAATGVGTLLMQLFVTSSILNHFGLRTGLLSLPAMLGTCAAMFMLQPSLVIATLAKFADQTIKFSLNNSSLELLWLPVHPDRRRKLKPLVGGTLKAVAEAAAGLLTLFVLKKFDFQFLSAVSLAAIAAWVIYCVRIASMYLKELGSAIERREVDMTGLDIDTHDPAFQRTISQELENPDLLRRLFALELMEGQPLKPWAPRLREMLLKGVPEEQDRVLEIARNDMGILSNALVCEIVDQPGRLAAGAIALAADRGLTECLPALRMRLLDDDGVTRAQAAAAIVRISKAQEPEARAILTGFANEGTGEAQSIAVKQLWDDEASLPSSKLRSLLTNGSIEGRIAGAAVAARRLDDGSIPALVSQLSDARTASGAIAALNALSPEQVLRGIEVVLFAVPPSWQRVGVMRSIPALPVADAAAMLTRVLAQLEIVETRTAAASLLAMARREALSPSVMPAIELCTRQLTKEAYRCVRILHLLGEAPNTVLLSDHYRNRIRSVIPTMFILGSINTPNSPVEQSIRVYESADTTRLPFVLEFIDSAFQGENRTGLLPLLDEISWEEKDVAGSACHPDLPTSLEASLRDAVATGDQWESNIVRHYLISDASADAIPVVDLDVSMPSTLEKTILLKSVTMFQNIPAENLSRIAAIAEERDVADGTVLMREGEIGESLFVVMTGAIRIHRGENTLTVFGRGDCLGEMAVLDSSPRSASATATSKSTLLEIDQASFYEVMEAHPEIMHEIVRLLTRRLREANDRIAETK